jgi:hypothetical protein
MAQDIRERMRYVPGLLSSPPACYRSTLILISCCCCSPPVQSLHRAGWSTSKAFSVASMPPSDYLVVEARYRGNPLARPFPSCSALKRKLLEGSCELPELRANSGEYARHSERSFGYRYLASYSAEELHVTAFQISMEHKRQTLRIHFVVLFSCSYIHSFLNST